MEGKSFFVREFRIEWGQCDPAGIVFAPRFFDMFNESVILFFEACGLPPKRRMLEETGTLGFASVDVSARFLRPATYGDRVRIETALPTLGRSSLKFVHRLLHGADICVECSETRVWVAQVDGPDGGISAVPILEQVRTAIEAQRGKGQAQ